MLNEPSLVMTMKYKRMRTISIGIGIGLIALFIISRFGNAILGPRIKLDSIPTQTLTEPALFLSGVVKGGRLLWINGVQIPVDTTGKFATQLVVPPGYTIMTLEAADELGSRRRQQLPVYYLPQSSGYQGEPIQEVLTEDITNEL